MGKQQAQSGMPQPLFVAHGVNGQLAVYPDRVILARKGLNALMSQGLGRGDKEISLRTLSAIQWRNAGLATLGYIQFTFMGASDLRGGIMAAQQDENSVTFNRKQQKEFEQARALIDRQRAAYGQPHEPTPHVAPQAPVSAADELAKWAALRDSGAITAADYEAKKRQLLGL